MGCIPNPSLTGHHSELETFQITKCRIVKQSLFSGKTKAGLAGVCDVDIAVNQIIPKPKNPIQ